MEVTTHRGWKIKKKIIKTLNPKLIKNKNSTVNLDIPFCFFS